MSIAETLLAAATFPARLVLSLSRTALHLGRLSSPEGPILRPGGYAERLAAIAELMAPHRPLGQAVAEGGSLDRLFSGEGPVARLAGRGGALDRLLASEGAVERLVAPDGPLERLLAPGGLLDRVLTDDGYAEKLLAAGGTLDQLVALGATLEDIRPRLTELAEVVPSLHEAVDSLGRSVTPLSDLATRFPGSRRKAQAATS